MRGAIKYCIWVLLMVCSMFAYGQGENNMWCFGRRCGMDFNNGPPVFFLDSILATEGCATACDAGGHLLFYTNGEKVWDSNGNLMPNGTGLIGSVSTTQGSAIIQSFTNHDQYFLFTMDYANVYHLPNIPAERLVYSVVDMSLNGGFGDIIVGQKNIVLDSNMTEKMLPIKNGCSFDWILVHNKSEHIFHAFKIDATGVNPSPVISSSGIYSGDYYYSSGEMKYSPLTGLLALANRSPSYVELDSFNINTGVVSHPAALDTFPAFANYGLSFSPDGGKLYTGGYQYDVSLLPNIQAVKNSRVGVGAPCSGMRIGPDGKIYFCNGVNGSNVGAINYPNIAGPGCGLVYNVVALPNYPASFLQVESDLGNDMLANLYNTNSEKDTIMCIGITPLVFAAPLGYSTYQWSDGSISQTDTFSTAGIRWVLSINNCDIRTDTFNVIAGSIDTITHALDTSICFAINSAVLSGPAGYNTYLWSDGFTIQQDSFSMPGTKWVYAQTGCTMEIDTFHVHDWRDTTKTSFDTSHCVAYSPIPVTAPGGYTSYLWSDGKIGQPDTFFSTTIKWVTALNGCNMLIDTVHFTATTIPPDSVAIHGIDTTICFENVASVDVNAPAGYTFYLWSDGTPLQTDAFTGPATKWVYAQKLCYLLIDTFTVSARPIDTLTGRIDTMICTSEMITLSDSTGYDTYLWSDGNTSQSDTFSNTTTKEVYAHKACAERIDTFHVQYITDLSVNLGNDTALCKGEIITLNATSAYNIATYLWQDNSTNATYHVSQGGDYSVKVSVGPCSVSDTIRVLQKVVNVNLGKGLVPCGDDAITLDAGIDSSSYLWQDGSTKRTYKATKDGVYSVKVTQGLCSTTATVTVKFEGCPCVVVIPTAFSPNNDGKNDKFGPTISCPLNSYRLMIYNRWGNRVFYTENAAERWDGTYKNQPLDGDVFNYYLEFKDGENKSYYYKGDVTLVR